MKITKRNGSLQTLNPDKIRTALEKALHSAKALYTQQQLDDITHEIVSQLVPLISVEEIQDLAEDALMSAGQHRAAKAYILYRNEHAKVRQSAWNILQLVPVPELEQVLQDMRQDFPGEEYNLDILANKAKSFIKSDMRPMARLKALEQAAVELVSRNAPQWEMIAARILDLRLHLDIQDTLKHHAFQTWKDKLAWLEEIGLLGNYILPAYTDQDIAALEAYMKPERDKLFNHSGLDLLAKRYLLCGHDRKVLETPQEMFMTMAMHLALPERDKVHWAKTFYDMLSKLEVTMATPTMANARRPFHQMSSCFIDVMDDSLTGIYKTIDNFAQVSKHGGGMGIYAGKVRASGSSIRGFQGAAGGVIRWIKLVNDTATAVDQLGVRQGACAVYLDVWHKDVPEFLQLRTNNGDDRMKAHDIFPALCMPDLFWKKVKEGLDQEWTMFCPHEIWQVKGWRLEDSFGKEWEVRYQSCLDDPRLSRRTISLKELVRLIIKSLAETGTPFVFNRDLVNEANPHKDKGMIYASNLCTEIAQNMAAMEVLPPEEMEVDGETIIVQKTRPGEFVVCNLASLTLGRLDVKERGHLMDVTEAAIRALDNVIDLNFYPVPFAKLTNQKYRAVGLGTSGYAHMLAKNGIRFESEEHLQLADELYEDIAYAAIQASMRLAKEKGACQVFVGSEFQSGEFFKRRHYDSARWKTLEAEVKEHGMRNGYLMAVAPTSSTSIIAGTTAAVDPIMKKFFLEEKKGSMITRVAPDLNDRTFWLYKNAHHIDQNWLADAAGIRQRHIDQAQSVNFYVTSDWTFRQLLNLYVRAWEKGVKTVYYVRSQSLEVEECESCSA